MPTALRMRLTLAALALGAARCSPGGGSSEPPGAIEPGASGALAGKVIAVTPGESIQAAVDLAQPGDTVVVRPGTYREAGRPCPTNPAATCAVVVEKDGIALVGLSAPGRAVVLENAGGQDQGIAVARSGADGSTCLADATQRIHGSRIEGFTVRGFGGEGIFLFCVEGWAVSGCAAHDNAEYGIFPSHSLSGSVERSIATGSNDTGIYVGQSRDVRVAGNVARDNVSGFEIENSSDVRVEGNLATGNTAGILSFTLPFLDVAANSDNVVRGNVVVRNNRANTCLDPTDTVCLVPSGTGILLLAADGNRVAENLVLGNDTAGVAVFDFCTATRLPPDACAGIPIDPLPDGNRIVRNVVLGNGEHPDLERLPPGVPGGDLLWSGAGTGNCWERNLARTIVSPVPLPVCP